METDGSRNQMDTRDEIDLRRYLSVLWQRRTTIIVVTVAAMLAGGMFSVLSRPIFEASAMVLVAKPSFQVGAPPDPTNPGLKIGTMFVSELPTETLVAFARSPVVQQKVVKKISGEGSLVLEMGFSLSAQTVRNTNLVDLKVRGNDPALVARVANEWAVIVAAESEALFSAEAQQSYSFFDGRLQEARRQLEAAEITLRDFNTSSEIGVLQARANAVTGQIASYESRMVDVSVALQKSEAELAQAENQLRYQPRTLTLSKSITSDPLLHRTASEISRQDFAAVSKLKLNNEELNPVYVNLAQARSSLLLQVAALRAERSRVEQAIVKLHEELNVLRSRLVSQQLVQSRLARTLDNANQVYVVLLQRREESRVASANQVGSVKLATEAILPKGPVGPRKVLNTIVAGMLGFFAGVLVAVVQEAYAGKPASQPLLAGTTVPRAVFAGRVSKSSE